MAKLVIFLATLAVLLLLTEASIYRTTIEIDEEKPRDPRKCQEQIREQQNLKKCQEFMRQQSGCRDNSRRQQLDQCCDQLEQLDSKCRCQGLEQAVKEQLQGQRGNRQSEEERKLYDVARDIPSKCDMKPRECQFSSPRVWF